QALDDLARFAGGNVPDANDIIPAGRGQYLAVRREADAGSLAVVALELADFLAGGRVPQAHGGVLAGTGDEFAVRREGDGTDRPAVAQAGGADSRAGALR